MTHARTIVRNTVTLILQPVTGVTRKTESRFKPTKQSDLPLLNVVSGEEVKVDDIDSGRERRRVELHVVLYALAEANVEDVLDSLAEQVEALLLADETLGNKVESIVYTGASPDYDSAAAQEIASLALKFDVTYIWTMPEVSADAFTLALVSVDMAGPRNDPQLPAGPDGQIDSVDQVALPQ